jgi:hypothetical protein
MFVSNMYLNFVLSDGMSGWMARRPKLCCKSQIPGSQPQFFHRPWYQCSVLMIIMSQIFIPHNGADFYTRNIFYWLCILCSMKHLGNSSQTKECSSFSLQIRKGWEPLDYSVTAVHILIHYFLGLYNMELQMKNPVGLAILRGKPITRQRQTKTIIHRPSSVSIYQGGIFQSFELTGC